MPSAQGCDRGRQTSVSVYGLGGLDGDVLSTCDADEFVAGPCRSPEDLLRVQLRALVGFVSGEGSDHEPMLSEHGNEIADVASLTAYMS